jgi:hypothetical protein
VSNILYVRYYPNNMLSCGGQLSRLAEFAHRRMCDVLWARNESLPNQDTWLAQVARLAPREWQGVKPELVRYGWRVRRNRWTNPEAVAVLEAAREVHTLASQRAIAGNDKRWRRGKSQAAIPEPAPAAIANSKTVSTEVVRTSSKYDERSSLNAQDAGQGSDKETRFIADVAAVIAAWSPKEGSKELAEWGGWWRNRYRENPRKTEKVLAEIKGLIREHRVRRSPGAAAMDLWGRLP